MRSDWPWNLQRSVCLHLLRTGVKGKHRYLGLCEGFAIALQNRYLGICFGWWGCELCSGCRVCGGVESGVCGGVGCLWAEDVMGDGVHVGVQSLGL